MIFDGRIEEPDGTIVDITSPAECAEQVLARIRVDIPASVLVQIKPHIVLDVQWFDDMDYGKELLHELYRVMPSGNLGKVLVCSKWADKQMRIYFGDRFEVIKPMVVDKSSMRPELLWSKIFPQQA